MERKFNPNIIAFTIIMVVLLISALTQADTSKSIIGKWKMEKVLESEEDVTKNHNTENDRWIQFNRDGTFESDGQPYGPNTGKFVLDDSLNLFLDSDAGPDDDSQWKVEFADNTMTWKGKGSPRAESFTLIHTRQD